MAAKKKTRQDNDIDDSDDFDTEDVDWKDDAPEDDTGARSAAPPGVRLRDWRDVERFREERELKRLLAEDELLFDDD